LNLEIVYAPACLRDLDEIFLWNQATYGFDHAWRYIESLRRQIDGLLGQLFAENVFREAKKYDVFKCDGNRDGMVTLPYTRLRTSGYSSSGSFTPLRIGHQNWQTSGSSS
jgi:hypothetical protein